MKVIQNGKNNTSNKNNTVHLNINENLSFLETALGNSIGLNIGKFKIGNKNDTNCKIHIKSVLTTCAV